MGTRKGAAPQTAYSTAAATPAPYYGGGTNRGAWNTGAWGQGGQPPAAGPAPWAQVETGGAPAATSDQASDYGIAQAAAGTPLATPQTPAPGVGTTPVTTGTGTTQYAPAAPVMGQPGSGVVGSNIPQSWADVYNRLLPQGQQQPAGAPATGTPPPAGTPPPPVGVGGLPAGMNKIQANAIKGRMYASMPAAQRSQMQSDQQQSAVANMPAGMDVAQKYLYAMANRVPAAYVGLTPGQIGVAEQGLHGFSMDKKTGQVKDMNGNPVDPSTLLGTMNTNMGGIGQVGSEADSAWRFAQPGSYQMGVAGKNKGLVPGSAAWVAAGKPQVTPAAGFAGPGVSVALGSPEYQAANPQTAIRAGYTGDPAQDYIRMAAATAPPPAPTTEPPPPPPPPPPPVGTPTNPQRGGMGNMVWDPATKSYVWRAAA